jgi:hypothetical protein
MSLLIRESLLICALRLIGAPPRELPTGCRAILARPSLTACAVLGGLIWLHVITQVAAQAAALDHELSAFAAPDALCKDFDPRCQAWAAHGQCKTNEGFMKYECRASCKYCDPVTGHVLTVRGQYY